MSPGSTAADNRLMKVVRVTGRVIVKLSTSFRFCNTFFMMHALSYLSLKNLRKKQLRGIFFIRGKFSFLSFVCIDTALPAGIPWQNPQRAQKETSAGQEN
jgi:hypothetical protein